MGREGDQKRIKELSKKYRTLYGHTPLSAEELKSYLEEGVEVVVVGTGNYGALPITEEAERLLDEKGIELVVIPSEEATSGFNELVKEGKKVIAIIHTTC